jgi:hypothetical protein
MNWKRHKKESDDGLIEVLYRHFPGEIEENYENSVRTVSWPRFELGI